LTFKFKVRVADAETLFAILPSSKLLTFNLPANAGGLVEVILTSAIDSLELKKLIQQVTNESVLIDSLKINYD